jgi:hypothetical protein
LSYKNSILLISLLLIVKSSTTSGDDDWLEEPTKLVKGLHGGVASEQGDCSKIGVDSNHSSYIINPICVNFIISIEGRRISCR